MYIYIYIHIFLYICIGSNNRECVEKRVLWFTLYLRRFLLLFPVSIHHLYNFLCETTCPKYANINCRKNALFNVLFANFRQVLIVLNYKKHNQKSLQKL